MNAKTCVHCGGTSDTVEWYLSKGKYAGQQCKTCLRAGKRISEKGKAKPYMPTARMQSYVAPKSPVRQPPLQAVVQEEIDYTEFGYKLLPFESRCDYHLCVYCGQPADSVDHCPPSSRIDDYKSLGLVHEQFVLVKSCRDCNIMLSNSLQDNIQKRYEEAKNRLKKKLLGTTSWSWEEYQELGPLLRTSVFGLVNKSKELELRVAYNGLKYLI